MANRRIGGIIFVAVNGVRIKAKGSWTYNLGVPKRDGVVGSDEVHGFKEMPQLPYIEGAATDTDEQDLEALFQTRDATVTLELANGKVCVWEDAYYAGEGNVTTEEGEIAMRFESIQPGREVPA